MNVYKPLLSLAMLCLLHAISFAASHTWGCFPKETSISLLEQHVEAQLLNESSGYQAPCMGTHHSLSLGFFTNQSDFVIKQVLHSHCYQLGASLAHLGFGQRHKDLGASELGVIKRDDVLCCSLLRRLNHLRGR